METKLNDPPVMKGERLIYKKIQQVIDGFKDKWWAYRFIISLLCEICYHKKVFKTPFKKR